MNLQTPFMKLTFEIEVPDGAIDQSAEAELLRSLKSRSC
jgi:hypothetical protein